MENMKGEARCGQTLTSTRLCPYSPALLSALLLPSSCSSLLTSLPLTSTRTSPRVHVPPLSRCEMVVDGTVFIRAVQRNLQPAAHGYIHRAKHGGLAGPTAPADHVEVAPLSTAATGDVAPSAASPAAAVSPEATVVTQPTTAVHDPAYKVASTTDWSPPAVCWWALWSAGTVIAIVLLDLLIPSFDDLIGLAAALIASQTSLAWPAALAWGRTHATWGGWRAALGLGRAPPPAGDSGIKVAHVPGPTNVKGRYSSAALLTADVAVLCIAAAFLLSGTAANVEDIARNGTGVRKLFSCVLARR